MLQKEGRQTEADSLEGDLREGPGTSEGQGDMNFQKRMMHSWRQAECSHLRAHYREPKIQCLSHWPHDSDPGRTKPALARQWWGAAEGAALLGSGENQEHNTEHFKGGRKTTRNWLEGARKVTMGPAKKKNNPKYPGLITQKGQLGGGSGHLGQLSCPP